MVTGTCRGRWTRDRHTGADFLAFLKRLARAYPRGEVHLILDDVSTHKTPAVKAWLSRHQRRPRGALHVDQDGGSGPCQSHPEG
jgi:hypothetical protein